MKKNAFADKIKSSYYMDRKTEEQVVDIQINRLKKGIRIRKSGIVEEAIKLLYKMEFFSELKSSLPEKENKIS